ncbi:MAG TPA: HNH endonuclease signature motif containing protein [Armatimonadota bacterium]|nr:HNH endonuclease signature motif containing protein [Armatimonadota bacterium]HQK93419.1 HNH endonuclease signature motif containing protein [Armatimonadota bacterium]
MALPNWLHDDDRWFTFLDGVKSTPAWSAYPQEFFARLRDLRGRARIVGWMILEEGSASTQALQDNGYSHPPRAKQDLQEQGIAVLCTIGYNDRNGRRMAVYSFPSPEAVLKGPRSGRVALPKAFTDHVKAAAHGRCALCAGIFDPTGLQADHRVPYAIVGDDPNSDLRLSEFMAVCRSCNRAKSWTCEHCPNWTDPDPELCATCYWASPTDYTHISTLVIRRLDLTWQGPEIDDFQLLQLLAQQASSPLPEYVKHLLANHIRKGQGSG